MEVQEDLSQKMIHKSQSTIKFWKQVSTHLNFQQNILLGIAVLSNEVCEIKALCNLYKPSFNRTNSYNPDNLSAKF